MHTMAWNTMPGRPETNINRQGQSGQRRSRGILFATKAQSRANQILSSLTRGAMQMGYSRETFDPTTYFKRNQSPTEIPKVTGYGRCFLIRPPPTGPTEFLHIDPVGIMLTRGFKDTSADTIALLIDRNIQFPARYSDKVTKNKLSRETNPQAHRKRPALQHLHPSAWPRDRPRSWIKGSPRGTRTLHASGRT